MVAFGRQEADKQEAQLRLSFVQPFSAAHSAAHSGTPYPVVQVGASLGGLSSLPSPDRHLLRAGHRLVLPLWATGQCRQCSMGSACSPAPCPPLGQLSICQATLLSRVRHGCQVLSTKQELFVTLWRLTPFYNFYFRSFSPW